MLALACLSAETELSEGLSWPEYAYAQAWHTQAANHPAGIVFVVLGGAHCSLSPSGSHGALSQQVCVRACVRVCVCVRARVCVLCVCACVCTPGLDHLNF